MVDRDGPLEPIRTVCRYANETIQKLLPPELQPMFADWAKPWIGESLCVLYVAMTRAVHALDMIIAPSKPNEKTWPKTYAGLLRSALAPGKVPNRRRRYSSTAMRPGTWHWPGGVRLWSAARDRARRAQTVARKQPPIAGRDRIANPTAPERRRRRGLDYRTPSGLEGSGKDRSPSPCCVSNR